MTSNSKLNRVEKVTNSNPVLTILQTLISVTEGQSTLY